MTAFIVNSAMSSDWVKSKPYTALTGVICASLGTMAGIGIINFSGVPIIGMISSVPFIMVGMWN